MREYIVSVGAMPFRSLRNLFSPPEPMPPAARVFSLPAGVRIYAVGDIHGRHHLLAEMLEAIAEDARQNPAAQIIEVFLGDYIDRGLHSREVIDLLLAAPPFGHQRICLRGNHEETLLRFLDDPKVLRDWANFGGYATLTSYGVAMPTSMSPEQRTILRDQLQKNLPVEHEIFLRNLEMVYQSGDYLFVHAGIAPNLPLAEQTPEHLLWIRQPFLTHKGFFDFYVVHGHSPVGAPEIYHNRANIDVSEAPTASLCCLVVEGSRRRMMLATDDKG